MDRKKIMCVDDEPAVLFAVKETLEGSYDIITASGGKDALVKNAQEKPDLVLMDVMMPDMDGFETAIRLQTGLFGNTPPVMFLSASTSHDVINTGLLISGYGFITKPFQPSKLLKRLNAFFDTLEANSDDYKEYYVLTTAIKEVCHEQEKDTMRGR